MKVRDTLREAAKHLAAVTETARLDAELLMAHALGVSRSQLLISCQDVDTPAPFDGYLKSRMQSEPIAYILGKTEFYGREFSVTPDVLIPRGDSEVLIETAMELVPDAKRVLDLGTGSGALLVTAMLELPDASGVAIDASSPALEIAKGNAKRHGLTDQRVQFLHKSWRDDDWAQSSGVFDLILCNPPYVKDDAVLDRDVREYEPSSALFAGPDGLDDYHIVIPQLRALMNKEAVAVLEIGHNQAKAVTDIAETAGFSVEIRNDLANRQRCVILR